MADKKPEPVAGSAGPEQTNLLPNDTEDVFHVFLNNVFDPASAMRGALVGESLVIVCSPGVRLRAVRILCGRCAAVSVLRLLRMLRFFYGSGGWRPAVSLL